MMGAVTLGDSASISRAFRGDGIGLTGGRRMNGLERRDKRAVTTQLQRVTLNELKGVIRLWNNVYANYVKPCQMVSNGGPASTTEQVKQLGTTHATSSL